MLFSYNASHYHTSLSVRAIRSAVSDLQAPPQVTVLEFSLKDKRDAVLNALYREDAEIYGFSGYIWNITETLHVAESLKKLRPAAKIFFGGPEVSFRADEMLEKHPFIDCVVSGAGEEGVKELLSVYPEIPKKIFGGSDPLFLKRKPHYFLADGAPEELDCGKFVYYESSRGCPFSCGYCLSGSDCKVVAKTAQETLDDLYLFERLGGGRRTVKLVDRTFNYDLSRAKKIWSGLLDEKYTHCYHFEIQPSIIDREAIEIFSRAPEGKFQLEVGIQSVNSDVLKECGRGGDIEKELKNLKLLKAVRNVPVHVDLICGLPLDDIRSIENSVNTVYGLSDELQIGFLKLLYGTKIASEKDRYGIKHRSEPPYEVLCTDTLSFDEIYELKGIAHTVDRVFNSGRFSCALELLLGSEETDKAPIVAPFTFFRTLAQSLGGNPAAYSQAAVYEKVYAEGLKYIKNEEQRREYQSRCREDFQRCERTRMPPSLAQKNC